MGIFYVYIVFSVKLHKFYVGSTNNLQRRFEDHNRGKTKFAKQGMPWKLVYHEAFPDRYSAYNREMEIKKKKSRQYIERLIDQAGSEYPD